MQVPVSERLTVNGERYVTTMSNSQHDTKGNERPRSSAGRKRKRRALKKKPRVLEQNERKSYEDIVEQFSRIRVMVVGDFISDEYIYGKPFKLSREAPVVVIRHQGERVVPGGAGNAVNNLASVGARAYPVGMVGNDRLGKELLNQLREKRVNVDAIVVSNIISTTAKTRIMAGDDHTSKQQVIRIDKVNQDVNPSRLQETVYQNFKTVAEKVDAIIVSDYGYGVVSRRITSELEALAKRKIVVVDSRYQIMRFRGVTAVTPNESEAERATRLRIQSTDDVVRAANRLQSRLDLKAVLITRGNRGMALLDDKGAIHHIPIFGSDDVTDVTGAGDTVATVFTLAVAAGAGYYEAACLANCAAGIVVMKSGTAVITREELLEAVKKNREGQGMVDV